MSDELSKSDLELLSAWMDGELDADQTVRVAALVAADPLWRRAHLEFQAVDAGLDALPAPVPPPGLTDRIMAHAGRRSYQLVFRASASLAAAAAIVLAVWLAWPISKPPPRETPLTASPTERRIDAALADVPPEDRLIVRKLKFFSQYLDLTEYRQVSDVADAQTLSALAELDRPERL